MSLITETQSAAFYENRGLCLGEQADDIDTLHRCRTNDGPAVDDCAQCGGVLDDLACHLCLSCCDARLVDCACAEQHLYGADPDCPGCSGLGKVIEPNVWCDACGLTGACNDCDGDAYDRRGDR
jgi:hypothetical protein